MSQLSTGTDTLRRKKAQGLRDSGTQGPPAPALNQPESGSLLAAIYSAPAEPSATPDALASVALALASAHPHYHL